jgi:hypothetical protein
MGMYFKRNNKTVAYMTTGMDGPHGGPGTFVNFIDARRGGLETVLSWQTTPNIEKILPRALHCGESQISTGIDAKPPSKCDQFIGDCTGCRVQKSLIVGVGAVFAPLVASELGAGSTALVLWGGAGTTVGQYLSEALSCESRCKAQMCQETACMKCTGQYSQTSGCNEELKKCCEAAGGRYYDRHNGIGDCYGRF